MALKMNLEDSKKVFFTLRYLFIRNLKQQTILANLKEDLLDASMNTFTGRLKLEGKMSPNSERLTKIDFKMMLEWCGRLQMKVLGIIS